MYPLAADRLSLVEVSRHWARDLSQHPSGDEVLQTLLAAVFRGGLAVARASGAEVTARELLRLVVWRQDHPQIRIFTSAAAVPSNVVRYADGSIEVDLSKHIVVPEDERAWTDDVVEAACGVLAECSLEDYSDLIKPGLTGLYVERDAFAAFCETNGYGRPGFWVGPTRRPASLIKARHDCVQWLRKQAEGGKSKVKSACLREAKRLFPSLSDRGFNEAWRQAAPDDWKRAGAPATRHSPPGPASNDADALIESPRHLRCAD